LAHPAIPKMEPELPDRSGAHLGYPRFLFLVVSGWQKIPRPRGRLRMGKSSNRCPFCPLGGRNNGPANPQANWDLSEKFFALDIGFNALEPRPVVPFPITAFRATLSLLNPRPIVPPLPKSTPGGFGWRTLRKEAYREGGGLASQHSVGMLCLLGRPQPAPNSRD